MIATNTARIAFAMRYLCESQYSTTKIISKNVILIPPMVPATATGWPLSATSWPAALYTGPCVDFEMATALADALVSRLATPDNRLPVLEPDAAVLGAAGDAVGVEVELVVGTEEENKLSMSFESRSTSPIESKLLELTVSMPP